MIKHDQVDILLVEDNAADAELTIRGLKSAGLANEIYHAEDGAQALQYLFSHEACPAGCQGPRPKLILLDLKLPKVSGLEVLRKIRSDERTKLLPLVVLTSSREDRDLKECYRLGANSYIVKPIRFEDFIATVSNLGLYWLLIRHIHETPPDVELFGFGDFMIRACLNRHGLLDQPIEQHSSRFRGPAVESECKLIQVVVQLFFGHPALVDAQKPAFEQGGDPMNPGENHPSTLLTLVVQNGGIVDEAKFCQSIVSPGAIRYDCATWSNMSAHKSDEVLARRVIRLRKPNSPHALAADLSGNYDQRPVSTTVLPADLTPGDSLIHFHGSGQQLTPGADHSPPQFMQHHPGRFVASETQGPLQSQGTDPAFLIGHPPYGAKPNAQRELGGLENRSGCHRDVPLAAATSPQTTPHLPGLAMSAFRALVAIRPSQAEEIVPTFIFGAEPLLELQQSLGIALSHQSIL